MADSDDWAAARPFFEQAVAVRRASYDPGHWRIAEAQSELGACLAASGQVAAAAHELRAGLSVLESDPDPDAEAAAVVARARLARLGRS